MRLGFRHTAFQAVCTVLVLCFALGLLERADTVQPVFGEDSVRVPILMYHSILRDSARQGGKYVISPAVLAADLDALQEKGYTAVTVSDLLAYVQDGADLPEKPVMITFDDGYYNNYDVCLSAAQTARNERRLCPSSAARPRFSPTTERGKTPTGRIAA